ncbi:MAG: cell division protein [Proteobacteria bacterium]|nr:MAG: cell division protein [Pseudomonadota bacterium]
MATDKTLFYLSAILISIGIIFSLSLSVFTVLYYGFDEYHFFIRQLSIGLLSILLMWLISLLNPDKAMPTIGFLIFFLFLIAMGGMHYLPSSMITESGGARRWIRLPGFSLAPVEFFKIGFVYFLAWSFNRKLDDSKKTLTDELKLLLPYIGVFILVVYLVAVMQNDLGQVVVLALTLAVMAFCAGTSFRFFALGIFGTIVVGVIVIIRSENRILRIKTWWAGVQDMVLDFFPKSVGDALRVNDVSEPDQMINSLSAIKHGGFFGEGLGQGSFKLGFLSDIHTDFVLSGISEEVGAIGVAVLTFLIWLVIYRIFRIAGRSTNNVYYLFSLGIGLLISFSFLMNAYGITSLTPIKGIAVPFLSYGGSSLLSLCIGIGMVLMVSKRLKH